MRKEKEHAKSKKTCQTAVSVHDPVVFRNIDWKTAGISRYAESQCGEVFTWGQFHCGTYRGRV